MPDPFEFPTDDPEWIKESHAENYLQSWSKQGSKPKVITGAEGHYYTGADGSRIYDTFSGLWTSGIGHCHPKIVEAVQQLDYTLIMGTTVFYGAFLVFMVIAVDVVYGFIDPRVRLE